MISMAAGDASKSLLVKKDGDTVGIVKMNKVIQALVAPEEPESKKPKSPIIND